MSAKGAKHWTKVDRERLRMFWPTYPKSEIRRMFPGRSWDALGQKAAQLGIRRKWKWGGGRGKTKDPLMEAFREIREAKGFSARALSLELGGRGCWIAKCERGAAGPSYHMLTRWCAALGVTLKVEKREGV